MTKDAKVLGLFLATCLTVTSGCGYSNSQHTHIDRNHDGYCDIDGQPMNNSSSGGGSGYHGSGYSGSRTSSSSSEQISTGTSAPKSGIGSHSSGSMG